MSMIFSSFVNVIEIHCRGASAAALGGIVLIRAAFSVISEFAQLCLR